MFHWNNLKAVNAIIGAALLLTMSSASAQEASTLHKVLERGHVIVGTSSEAPPFCFVNDEGELVGFDIDIAKLVAKQLFGEKGHIEFVKQGFAARWANASSGKIDFGAQVTTIHSQRPTKVAFTRGYVDTYIVLISKKGSGIKTTADANSADVTVANLTVPQQRENAEKFFPKAELLVFDSTAALFSAVKSGRADAAQLDVAQAQYYANRNPNIQVAEGRLTVPRHNALFTKHGDFTWWLYLDTIVREMRQGHLYNQYAEIYEKWFGRRPEHGKYYVEEQLRSQEAQ